MIPQFNNTEEALKFGKENVGNLDLINYMGDERQRLLVKVQSLTDEGRQSEALYLASGQVQFIREALEKMKEGKNE